LIQLAIGDARAKETEIDGIYQEISACAALMQKKDVREALHAFGVPRCPQDIDSRWFKVGDIVKWLFDNLATVILKVTSGLQDRTITIPRDVMETLVAAGYAAPRWLALFGSLQDATAALESNRATVGDVILVLQEAVVIARGHSQAVKIPAHLVDALSECVSKRVFDGDAGLFRCAAMVGTPWGRDMIRQAAEARQGQPLPFEVFGVTDELNEAGGLRRPEQAPTADGACCATFRSYCANPIGYPNADVDALWDSYDALPKKKPRRPFIVQRPLREEKDEGDLGLRIADISMVREAVSEFVDAERLELDEAADGGPPADDGGESTGGALRPLVGAVAAPGSSGRQTLEQIDPGHLYEAAVTALTRLAPLVDGVNPAHVAPGLRIWLKEPVRGRERTFDMSLHQMWHTLGAGRWLLEPVAKLFKLLLALPAGEAHCERIIGALRKMVSPFGFSMSEKTMLARLAAHGRE
jgi:hypothetical protein